MPGKKYTAGIRLKPAGFSLLLSALAASLLQCGFPEYDFQPQVSSAGSPAAGQLGTAGEAGEATTVGGTAASGGADPGEAGKGGAVNTGMAGNSGAAGAGQPACAFPDPILFPEHCYDEKWGDGESAVDCGGGECPACSGSQACLANRDCASGKCLVNDTCAPVLDLSYNSIVADKITRTIKFKLALSYSDSISTPLKDLRIRYYFNHNGVAEPVIALNTQATFDPGGSVTDIASKVSWLVHRSALGPLDRNGRKTDSYLEISFNSPASISAGGQLELTQDIVAGSDDLKFDQSSHYSFLSGSAPNQAITVYRRSQRIWGREPPLKLFPRCAFVHGVNLGGGPALVIDGEGLSQEADEHITFSQDVTYTNPTAKAVPGTDTATTALLTTARTLHPLDTASWPIENGTYWAYAWLTSAGGSDIGTLTIQDNPADRFVGTQRPAGAGWSLVGPYPIDVSEGAVVLSATGTVHVAGVKLYQMAP